MPEQIIDPRIKPALQAELERRDREARRTPRERSDEELRDAWLAMTDAQKRHIQRQVSREEAKAERAERERQEAERRTTGPGQPTGADGAQQPPPENGPEAPPGS